ncbi:MAG: pentapeptide repeat-containing protein [Nostoc sp.]|uniref:pentapeptide repeat-containing protein n=1 Tax=Nostoc sp. TaxID=1180 RepID=UPI002FF8DAFB
MPQDFSCQNLRNRSFKGQNLAGANFSYADIRGADFTGANLTGVNFSHAKAGLKRYSVICLLSISLTLAALSGLVSGFISSLIGYFFQPINLLKNSFPPNLAFIILLAIFFTVLIRQGIKAAFTTLAFTFTIASILTLTGAFLAVLAIFGILVGVVAVAISISVAGKRTGMITIAESLIICEILVIIGFKPLTQLMIESTNVFLLGTELPTMALALICPILSAYIAWQALLENEQFAWVQKIVMIFLTFASGTSFRGADLTDANFTEAMLLGCNLKKATITRTRWFQAKLDYAKLEGTILIQAEVRDLLVTGQGKDEFFTRLNFRGANLTEANLMNARFTESDLSQATLNGACLEKANLTRVQAQGTDFRKAILTGACLESWMIDNTTRFDGVICDYIYLGNRQRERHPNIGIFTAEEFAKLFGTGV